MSDNWSEMSYDEQRAFLGLPDVRAQVAWYRLGLAARVFGEAFTEFGSKFRRAFGQGELVFDIRDKDGR